MANNGISTQLDLEMVNGDGSVVYTALQVIGCLGGRSYRAHLEKAVGRPRAGFM
jgi:hypothetical protein